MLSQDLPEIRGIVDNIGKQQGIDDVFLLNRRSEIRFSPRADEIGKHGSVKRLRSAAVNALGRIGTDKAQKALLEILDVKTEDGQ